MQDTVRVAPFGTVSIHLPSVPVIVPFIVPFSMTLAPTTGVPSASETTPPTCTRV